MTIKPSNVFGSNETETKFTGNYVKEKKSPDSMFMEPVHIGQCPLCGGDVYSENDPSNDHTMSRRCCECTWNDNQFMTWEEMNGEFEMNVIAEHRPSKDIKNYVLKDDKESEEALTVVQDGDSYNVNFDLGVFKSYHTFFTQGLLIDNEDGIVLMCSNSSVHHFIVKFDGKDLKTVRLSECKNLDGFPFCYDEEKGVIEFLCKSESEVNSLKGILNHLLVILFKFKRDILDAINHSNVEIDLLGENFSELELVDESVVSLGYTNKLFKSGDNKVIISSYKEGPQKPVSIIPRIYLSNNKWTMKISYGRNHKVDYR